MRTCALAGVVGAAALTLGSTALASSVDMFYTGNLFGRNFDITFGGETSATSAGTLAHTITSGAAGTPFQTGQTILTFCTELDQGVASAGATYDIFGGPSAGADDGIDDLPVPGAGMGMEKALVVSALFENFFRDAKKRDQDNNTDRNEAAAFQIALWEIVYDSDNSLTDGTGAFSVEARGGDAAQDEIAIALAQTWLDAAVAAAAADGASISTSLFGFGNLTQQDQLFLVPLPAGALLGLAGLGGVVVMRRRLRG